MTKLSSYLCSSQKSLNSFSSELCLDGKLFKYSQENSMLVTIVVNCHIASVTYNKMISVAKQPAGSCFAYKTCAKLYSNID